MQFSRIITPVENIQVWNTTSDGFSFVISFASRSGPGFRGNPGFIASWRPIHQNRSAVKVNGSPFKTLPEPLRLAKQITNEKPSLAAFHTWVSSTGVMMRLNCTVRLRKEWSEGPIDRR